MEDGAHGVAFGVMVGLDITHSVRIVLFLGIAACRSMFWLQPIEACISDAQAGLLAASLQPALVGKLTL